MDITNDEQERELLHSQAKIWNCIFSFINSASLKCAIQLGIPDIVHKHGKPITLSELNNALPVNQAKAHNISRLMSILVHFGFFTKTKIPLNEEEEGYMLTSVSHLLLKDEPMSIVPFLLANLDPAMVKPWHHLSEWLQNYDRTPFETAYGRPFWEYCGEDPKSGRLFNDAMASDARLVMSVVLKECRGVFMGLNSLVDVGGGTGTVAKIISDAFPELKCIVFDLPRVVDESTFSSSNNLNFVGGDMFTEIPPADAVMLKWILHDWSDEESVKILRKCKEAIPSKEKGGKVIIIDMNVDDQKGDAEFTETQLFFDMLMILVNGRERTEKEWAKLFSDAGFSDYKITPVLGLRSLIEVYP